MKKLMTCLLWLAALLCMPMCAHATITCNSITSPDITFDYPNQTTYNFQWPLNVTCTRSSTSDPTTVYYRIESGLVPQDNNSAPVGSKKALKLPSGGAYLYYYNYSDFCGGTIWQRSSDYLYGSMTFQSGVTGSLTVTSYFWFCMPAQPSTSATYYGQIAYFGRWNTTGGGSSFSYPNSFNMSTQRIQVYINGGSNCVIIRSPSDINLTYPAFSTLPVSGSTTFDVQCSSGTNYTMAVSPATGAILDVSYSLGLSASSGSGNGAAQTYTITATAAAGQAGTCAAASCTPPSPDAKTLTLTF